MPPSIAPSVHGPRWTPTWVGLAGTTLIGWGSCQPEFSHGPAGWPSEVVNAIGLALPMPWNRVAIVVGLVALAAAWWLLRPDGGDRRRLLGTMAVWSLPLLLVPPVLSGDAVLYADLGWILGQGGNPYFTGLTEAGGPYAAQVDPMWAGNGVAYPPLALLVDKFVVWLAGASPYVGIIAMRLPVLAALGLAAWVLPRLAVRFGLDGTRALWWGLANPLVVVHFVGGAHNDALMLAVALVAIWVATRGSHWAWGYLAGPALIGVAMAIKPQAGLAVLACAGLPVAGQLPHARKLRQLLLLGYRTLLATLVVLGTFGAVSLASGLGFGWVRWLSLMGKAGTAAPFSLLAQVGERLIVGAGDDPTGWLAGVGTASTCATVAVLGWVLFRFADRPLAAVAWGALAVSTLGQAMHPWYLPWPIALLALVPLSRRQDGWLTLGIVALPLANAVQTVVWHAMQ